MIMVGNDLIVDGHQLYSSNSLFDYIFESVSLIHLPFSFQLIDRGAQITELQQILKTLLLDKLDYLHI